MKHESPERATSPARKKSGKAKANLSPKGNSNKVAKKTGNKPLKIYDCAETIERDGGEDVYYEDLFCRRTYSFNGCKCRQVELMPKLTDCFINALVDNERSVNLTSYSLVDLTKLGALKFGDIKIDRKVLHEGYNIANRLRMAIGGNVCKLLQSEGESRIKEAAKLKSIICESIDLLAVGLKWKSHAKKTRIEADGICDYLTQANIHFIIHNLLGSNANLYLPSKYPMACIAIEYARRFVEKHDKLPTKRELRTQIEAKIKKSRELSAPAWTKIYKEAGLGSLGRIATW